MRIGMFIDTYEPQINGVVTSTKLLKERLEAAGHTVKIITVTQPDYKQDDPGIIRLPSIPFPPLPEHRMGTPYSGRAMEKIEQMELDLIHTQTEFSTGIFGRIAAYRLDLPVVHTYHTMHEDYVHYILPDSLETTVKPPARKLARKLSKFYCQGCARVIAPTEKAKDALQSYGVTTPIKVIPTGIKLSPFRKENYTREELQELRAELDLKAEEPVVLYVGRLAQEKSLEVAIKQFAQLVEKIPTAKFLIVGGGPEKERLEQLGVNLNISSSLIFAGEQPWEEIGKFYQLGDVFVSASTTETQGLTFVEAMAAKVPVVAKYDDNLEDLLTEGETGRVFYDNEELPTILYDLLTDEQQREKLAEQAYGTAQEMSAETFGNKVEQLYLEIMAER